MRSIITIITMISLMFLAACGPTRHRYQGKEVTQVVVNKSERKMYLLHNKEILRSYPIELGFSPKGHKRVRGDGKTPEGQYTINRRNGESQFYLSLGISYPNAKDIALARSLGKNPGGDIFIHGGRRPKDPKRRDWTAGCISVKNKDMLEIFTMVRVGTKINIKP